MEKNATIVFIKRAATDLDLTSITIFRKILKFSKTNNCWSFILPNIPQKKLEKVEVNPKKGEIRKIQ